MNKRGNIFPYLLENEKKYKFHFCFLNTLFLPVQD